MVAKRLSIGIEHPTPVLETVSTPSHEEVIAMLRYIDTHKNVGWDNLLNEGFPYEQLVWLANCSAVGSFGGMNPTLYLINPLRGNVSLYTIESHKQNSDYILSEFERYQN